MNSRLTDRNNFNHIPKDLSHTLQILGWYDVSYLSFRGRFVAKKKLTKTTWLTAFSMATEFQRANQALEKLQVGHWDGWRVGANLIKW